MAEGLARRQAELERAEASEREQRTTAERLYEASTRRLDHLHALRAIDVAIASSLDLSMTLHVVLEQVTTQLSADAAAILILNPKGLLLEFAAARGFKTPALRHTCGSGKATRGESPSTGRSFRSTTWRRRITPSGTRTTCARRHSSRTRARR
jgi:hypothetical protein